MVMMYIVKTTPVIKTKVVLSGSVESQSGFYEKWNNTATIFNHQITINGDYELDSDWSMTFNAGATSNARDYDRNGVRSTGQNVFNVLRHYNFNSQEEIEFVLEETFLVYLLKLL